MLGAILHVVAIFLGDDDPCFEYQKCVGKRAVEEMLQWLGCAL